MLVGIAPELRLKMLEASLGLCLIHEIILDPGDQVVQQASGFSGRARIDADLRVGGLDQSRATTTAVWAIEPRH